MNNVQLDIPVSKKDEDSFQRYEFSKRIASIINENTFERSLVIGIYGKWGEGKSSVLNFIKAELENTIVVNFNPWYFQEDKILIKSFFESVASSLNAKLNTKRDDVLKIFEDYGDALGSIAKLTLPSVIGSAFGVGRNLALKFKNDSLEHYKKRVEDILAKANSNFAVFIDDIDRLSIEEIQSIFKLVKLVGDFPRFSYVLSLDDELVASSLGYKFGDRKTKDGYDFLEKIVQLPITLPKASPSALKKYCLSQVERALDRSEVQLSKEDIQNFLGKFDSAFLPALKSPRLAVRFANSILFAIPLLKGEVNISDLMIVEGLKVFYPEFYHFLRSNGNIFLSEYGSTPQFGKEAREKSKEILDEQIRKYGDKMYSGLLQMLCNLFPQLNNLYYNYNYGPDIYKSFYLKKRICSAYYFERYFSYAVQEGDISDVYFDQIFSDAGQLSPTDFATRLKDELKKLNLVEFINKVKIQQSAFTKEQLPSICFGLSKLGTILPEQKTFQISVPKFELASIIRNMIGRLERNKRIEYCKEALAASDPIGYTLALFYKFKDQQRDISEESFLSNEEIDQLAELVIDKFSALKMKIHVYDMLPEEDINSIFAVYNLLNRNDEVGIEEDLVNGTITPVKIIRIFTPTTYGGHKNGPYKTVFSKEDYEFLKLFIDPAVLYDRAIKANARTTSSKRSAFTRGDELSDQDLINEFFQLFESNDQLL
jgi:hypothetical protein